MVPSPFLARSPAHSNWPTTEITGVHHHQDKGYAKMSNVNLIPGAKSTVHAFGLDAVGHQTDLPQAAVFSSDNEAIAKVVSREDLANAVDVVGVAEGTATLTMVAGALSATMPITVTVGAAVSIGTTVDPAVPVAPAEPDAPAQ